MSNAALAVRNERALSPFIPFTSIYNSTTLLTRQGDFVRTWRLKGIPFETADPIDVERQKNALNTFVRAIGSERVAFYQHTDQRRIKAPNLLPSFRNEYARSVHKAYQANLDNSALFVADIYLTIVYRADVSKIGGIFNRTGRTAKVLEHQRKLNLAALDRIGQRVETSFLDYAPSVLDEYENNDGQTCSMPLEFMNYLVSGFWQPVLKPSRMMLYDYLGTASVFIGTDVVEVRRPQQSRFSQMVEIKDFATSTFAGVLNPLYYLDVEFVICTSFCTLQRHDADNKMDTQIHHLNITDSADDARDVKVMKRKLGDEYSLGEFNLTIRVTADSVQEVRDDVADVMSVLEDRGYIAVTSGLATDSSFFSQVPGNFAERTRIAHLTSLNFAGFASMHNFRAGKANGNPWGNAVMPLKTDNNRLVYLNLHSATDLKDLRGKMEPACTTLLGMTGEGKTTLMNLIKVYMQQYNNLDKPLFSLTLDYKRGAEKVIRAMGGVYTDLLNDRDTGYSPFKMEPSPNTIAFLDDLVIYLCSQNGNTVTTVQEKELGLAVRAVMRMDRQMRGFTALLQNLTSDGTDTCIKLRLAKWAADDGTGRRGVYAWALDCEDDVLDFGNTNVFGIDGTDLLARPVLRTPILMYQLHRVKQVIGTRRVGLYVSEAFQWMNDPIAGPWMESTLTTIRSLDGFMVLDTQMPSTVLTCPIGPAIIEQTETFLFLKNPQACFDEYQRFGMDEELFTVFEDMPRRHFVIKQGDDSKTATLDLSGFSRADMVILAGEGE